MGPIELQATIDPARVGPNQLHLYLLDARTGCLNRLLSAGKRPVPD
jgi:hypothetical protein